MKITDVTVTLFKWENIPLKSYDAAVKMLSLIHISEPTRPVGISRMPSSA
mgnify:CR=1 FL=1